MLVTGDQILFDESLLLKFDDLLLCICWTFSFAELALWATVGKVFSSRGSFEEDVLTFRTFDCSGSGEFAAFLTGYAFCHWTSLFELFKEPCFVDLIFSSTGGIRAFYPHFLPSQTFESAFCGETARQYYNSSYTGSCRNDADQDRFLFLFH
jgi:hypothetical protein